jgi:hypothetical protein
MNAIESRLEAVKIKVQTQEGRKKSEGIKSQASKGGRKLS